MAERKVNYTDEMVAKAIEMYAEVGNEGIDAIAEALGRSVRSVRAKLVREGVYTATEQVKVARENGPTKKEMLNQLESLVDFPVDGLMGATKEAIQHLIDAFTVETEVEQEAA
jgi:hypothetical protein